ncbi:MAG: hydantoinase/oxoprolinase family protein, partial [Proteobacteria bacterium]|nr:hydantoinase/oxoprolinase family protein [Pseudomonadota bacterium]
LVLGRLNPDRLLGVQGSADLPAVRAALEIRFKDSLGLDAVAAAAAIVRIANDRMAGAIRIVSLARGHDPRDFVLFPFGGAGPLHAAAIARELGVPRLLVPARPGITNALGCVVADLRHDYVNTVNRPVPELDIDAVHALLAAQAAEGRRLIEREGVAVEGLKYVRSADMQFQGQTHILTVPLADATPTREALQQAFDRAYWTRFEVELPEIRAVLVNLHTAVIGVRPRIDLAALGRGAHAKDTAGAMLAEREVWFEGGFRPVPVYARERLPVDVEFAGPAIIEQLDCTTVLEPGNRARLDRWGNLLVEV